MNNEFLKFFLQYLIMPIMIAAFGFIINKNVNDQKQELEKLRFYEQIFKDAFDDKNPQKGIIMANMLPYLLKDEVVADTFKNMIYSYFKAEIADAAKNGDEKQFNNIAQAVEQHADKSNEVVKKINADGIVSKAETARKFEQQAMVDLTNDNLDAAKANFANAEKSYNGFHNAYEINRLIEQKQESNPTNTVEEKKQVAKEIRDEVKKKYSWGMNMNAPATIP